MRKIIFIIFLLAPFGLKIKSEAIAPFPSDLEVIKADSPAQLKINGVWYNLKNSKFWNPIEKTHILPMDGIFYERMNQKKVGEIFEYPKISTSKSWVRLKTSRGNPINIGPYSTIEFIRATSHCIGEDFEVNLIRGTIMTDAYHRYFELKINTQFGKFQNIGYFTATATKYNARTIEIGITGIVIKNFTQKVSPLNNKDNRREMGTFRGYPSPPFNSSIFNNNSLAATPIRPIPRSDGYFSDVEKPNPEKPYWILIFISILFFLTTLIIQGKSILIGKRKP